MKEREAMALLVAIGLAAGVAILAWGLLYGRFLQDEIAWIEAERGTAPADGITPRDLAELHEEARRITGESL